ncbi:MAG TPA: hypothetical protein VFP59_10215 [Candidatus Angelobacter sp.]|nr:hypothetical protein [Candidatus Angelobacter sp.]
MRLRPQIPGWALILLLTVYPAIGGESPTDKPQIHPPAQHNPQAVYKIEAGMQGEIYPVFANYASLMGQDERTFGVVAITVSNPGSASLRRRIAVRIPGWSDEEIQMINLAPGAKHTLLFAPSFLPRFYNNREIVAATVRVSVTDLTGRAVYESTVPVRLRSAEDMYWGRSFQYAPFIASWVTPHAPEVETVLARAKNYTPDRRLPGYENWKNAQEQEHETYVEAKAIFTALKKMGLSYVKSSSTLGHHANDSERVRMPEISLSHSSANCIDAVVAYASLFENLGMDPAVIIVPGHAYVGVRVAEDSSRFLFIDAALTGRTTFEAAVLSGQSGLAHHDPASITRVNIDQARSSGIYPMP